uniref:guanylate cyclase n=1 Tax=Heterorhabditis bacteriophora TaxID=37862 RepID=A0A1I7XIR4_HETBA
MTGWPSQYAGQLHDAFYTYARALNATLNQNSSALKDGRAIISNIQMSYTGISGPVTMNMNGSRQPTFYLIGLNSNGIPNIFGSVFVEGFSALFTPNYSSENVLWATRGGKRPLDIPVCGFTGSKGKGKRNREIESNVADPIYFIKLSGYKYLLWTAPELLRVEDSDGTKEGDIYSFAIICSELVTRKSVWDLDNRKEKAEELVYMIKKGGSVPIRPSLQLHENTEVNPAMLHLIRDCWSEGPRDRPAIDTVRSLMKSMNGGRNENLMDHVFNMLEAYASTLENEVEDRTKELVEEKKKSDILLYRMLPRQVAEKLKLGQSVEPETFDNVTVFFSDVVRYHCK